jgi:hypothetical protein
MKAKLADLLVTQTGIESVGWDVAPMDGHLVAGDPLPKEFGMERLREASSDPALMVGGFYGDDHQLGPNVIDLLQIRVAESLKHVTEYPGPAENRRGSFPRQLPGAAAKDVPNEEGGVRTSQDESDGVAGFGPDEAGHGPGSQRMSVEAFEKGHAERRKQAVGQGARMEIGREANMGVIQMG